MTQENYVAHMGKTRNVYKISVRKHDEKIQLGRPTHGQEDHIKRCLKRDVMMWTGL
jgi:hypothetical protein